MCNIKNFSQLSKNTVDSANQLQNSECVRYHNPWGKGKRIMLLGNSITLHGINHEIGWNNEWGMAASSQDKDYVHILMSKVNKRCKDTAFCICQIADWERNYMQGTAAYETFSNAAGFKPDIIVCRFIENCKGDNFEPAAYKKALKNLLCFLSQGSTPQVILTTGFWYHPGDVAVREAAAEWDYPLIELGDLGEQDEMKAIGLFWHEGVANHPGDLGMKTIAERIYAVLENYL